MEQQIRFCTSADGTRIAYATYGERLEAPLVCVWGWGAAQEQLWKQDDGRAWCATLSEGRQLVTFDCRGAGGSQREVDDLSLEAQAADVAAVVDHLRLQRFDLLGLDFDGSAVGVAYAVQHAERVVRLVLWRPLAKELRTEEETRLAAGLMRTNWPRALQLFAALRFPKGPEEQVAMVRRMRQTVSPEIAAKYYELDGSIDLGSLLPRVQVPALVLARRGDPGYVDGSRAVATLIPDARFVTVEGHEPFAYGDDVVRVVLEFLDEERARPAPPPAAAGLVTILFTDITDSTALTQRLGDAKAQELVRAHNAIVREALAAQGGTEIKHTGDGIMASFPTASGALECAIAIQRAVAAHADPNLGVHVGLNAGEPVVEDADLFGTAVQLARRICDQAQGGEILASDVVRQLAAGKNFLFADRGEVVPKGFDEAVRLYEVRWRE